MSSDTEQDETSFQADHLTTDAPPTYNEAAHHWSASGQTADTVKHQQELDPPPSYQGDSVLQAGSTNFTLSAREEEESSPPQTFILDTITQEEQSHSIPQPVFQPVPQRLPHSGQRTGSHDMVEKELRIRLIGVLFSTVLLFICGTPLTLFATIPSLYCIYRAKANLEDGELNKVLSFSLISTIVILGTFIVTIIIVIPVIICIAVIFST